MQKRLAFFRQAQTQHTVKSANLHSTGTLPSIGSTISDHMAAFNSIGNSGNMIHRAAMLQALSYDRSGSAQINLFRVMKDLGGAKKAAEHLERNFDGLVITMSNIFRPDAEEPGMAELLDNLKIPFYVVGAGIQNAMKAGDASHISKSVMDMMRIVEDKASLFGVRGNVTKNWLNSIGFNKAQAIGCPSMFAYPRNILSIKPPQTNDLILTAGHLLTGNSQKKRALTLIHGFRGYKPSYVFQGEPKHYTELLDKPDLWNEATQTIDKMEVGKYLSERLGVEMPFRRYFSFTESSAWRVAAAQHHLYIGDRIHGGVAAMQVGRPAIVLYSDSRVKELTNHHGIPSCDLEEFSSLGVVGVVEKYLTKQAIEEFHLKYISSLSNFYDAVESSGLNVSNKLLIPSNIIDRTKKNPANLVSSTLSLFRK
ncbi:polysaccharide pyruvyl transferase family protein [Brucella pituitosa]|uniref:polysaccharide pyruvyl transferase family protein n=1 Tax=Brucella pituitosa TaxID=571256 RepID=UPI003F4AD2B6